MLVKIRLIYNFISQNMLLRLSSDMIMTMIIIDQIILVYLDELPVEVVVALKAFALTMIILIMTTHQPGPTLDSPKTYSNLSAFRVSLNKTKCLDNSSPLGNFLNIFTVHPTLVSRPQKQYLWTSDQKATFPILQKYHHHRTHRLSLQTMDPLSTQ